jgi:hypothetical protein
MAAETRAKVRHGARCPLRKKLTVFDFMEWQTASKEWIEQLVRRGCNVHQLCSILHIDVVELRRLIHLYWPELPVTNRRSFATVTRLRKFLMLSGPILRAKPSRARKSSWSLPRSVFRKPHKQPSLN